MEYVVKIFVVHQAQTWSTNHEIDERWYVAKSGLQR
jgi:hypothetical protein